MALNIFPEHLYNIPYVKSWALGKIDIDYHKF